MRLFVDAIIRYCADRSIACDVLSDGWLVVMQRGGVRRLAFGYDIGLNSAAAHRIANDKSATSAVLAQAGIACIPHALFLGPELSRRIGHEEPRGAMRALLSQHPGGVVVKPNEGNSGRYVFHVTDEAGLDRAANETFAAHAALAISPFVEIEQEVRVVLLDGEALVVYRKDRGADWRHNLDLGARPVLLEQGTAREACVEIAIRSAQAIGIRFASIDVLRVADEWRVLEINSGVMMETLGALHPGLVQAAYHAALDRLFER